VNPLDRHNSKLELFPKEFNQPVFILGIMRSGTTLLLNIITEHPQLLKIGVELNTTWTHIGGAPIVGECKYCNDENLNAVYTANMTNYFSQNIQHYRSGRQFWKRWLFNRKFGSGGIKKDWENLYPVNKSPHLTNKVKYLNAMFPKARFIMIVREIEAQSLSQKKHFIKDYQTRKVINHLPLDEKQCWTRLPEEEMKMKNRVFPDDFSLIPEAWINLNYLAIKELEEINRNNYILFRYEDLIQKPQMVLPDMFSFLNLKSDYQDVEKRIINKERKKFNSHTSDPVNEWKSGLSDEEKKIIRRVIDINKDKFDYIIQKFKNE
jgi:hypothetical protein